MRPPWFSDRKVEAGAIGEHHVEHDQIRPEVACQIHRGMRVGGPRTSNPSSARLSQHLGQQVIVLDHQDAHAGSRRVCHAPRALPDAGALRGAAGIATRMVVPTSG